MKRPAIKLISVAILTLASAASAQAASRIEKIDIVREGIDLTPAYVKATSTGYSGFESKNHRFSVRMFAKGKGGNNIFSVGIGNRNGASLQEVSSATWHFRQYTPDDGWGVYKTSRTFNADLTKVHWSTTPGKLCRDNLARKMSQGKSRDYVLNREWKLSAKAILHFYAAAAAPSKIRNNRGYDHGETRMATLFYPINVTCRAK